MSAGDDQQQLGLWALWTFDSPLSRSRGALTTGPQTSAVIAWGTCRQGVVPHGRCHMRSRVRQLCSFSSLAQSSGSSWLTWTARATALGLESCVYSSEIVGTAEGPSPAGVSVGRSCQYMLGELALGLSWLRFQASGERCQPPCVLRLALFFVEPLDPTGPTSSRANRSRPSSARAFTSPGGFGHRCWAWKRRRLACLTLKAASGEVHLGT